MTYLDVQGILCIELQGMGAVMKINKELIGASTGLLILGMLSRSPRSYGYQIVKSINDEAVGIFAWQEGTVYPVLHKMEKNGLIRSQWEIAENGRKRKYYYITTKGREALKKSTNQWNEFNQLILRVTEVQHA